MVEALGLDVGDPTKRYEEDKASLSQRTKLAIFHLFFKVVKKCACPVPIYVLLSIFELLQFTIVLLHIEHNTFKSALPDYLYHFFDWAQTYILVISTDHFVIGLFCAMTGACLFGAGLLIFGIFHSAAEIRSVQAKEAVAACFPGFLSLFLALFKKGLVFYIVYTSTQVYLCNNVSNVLDCMSELHVFFICCGILNLLLTAGILSITFLFFHDEKPDSTLPWALSGSRIDALVAVKMALSALITSWDEDSKYSTAYLFVFCSIDGFILYLHLFAATYIHYSVQIVGIVSAVLTAIFAFYLAVITLYDEELKLHPLLLLFVIFAVVTVLHWKRKRQCRIYGLMTPHAHLSPVEIKEMAYTLIALASSKKESLNMGLIAGLVKNHMRYCCIEDCKCHLLAFKENEEAELFPTCEFAAKTHVRTSAIVAVEEAEPEKALLGTETSLSETLYEILNLTLKNMCEKGMSAGTEIIQAYVNYYKLNNMFKALYNLMLAEEAKTTLFQEYLIYSLRKEIELCMLDEEKRNTSSLRLDFNKMVTFHQKYMALHDLVSQSTVLYSRYWAEYLKAQPDLDTLIQTGFQISLQCEQIEETLQFLNSLNPNNIKGMILFALFQKKVVEDNFGAYESFLNVRRQEDTLGVNRKFLDEIDMKYGSHSNAAVVVISGNRQDLGTVVNANHELYQILGFSKNEVIGENISYLMPELIGTHHSSLLENFFERQARSRTSTLHEQLIFPQHIRGYIVPCSKLVRLVPNLDKGVQFLAFINKAVNIDEVREGDEGIKTEDVIMLLLDEAYQIHGFNATFARLCCRDEEYQAFNRYLEVEKKLNLATLYPQLVESENEHLLHSSVGLEIRLNISVLRRAISSEVLDYYSEEGSEAPHPEGESKRQSRDLDRSPLMTDKASELVARFSGCCIDIKIKDYAHCKGLVKYKICTMLPVENAFHRAAPDYEAEHNDLEDAEPVAKHELSEDHADTASVTTSSNVSLSSVENKFAKEMKRGMKDKRVSKNVRILQLIAVVIGLIIITVSSVEYALLYNNLTDVQHLFTLSRDVFNRVTSVMLIAAYLRVVRNIAMKISTNNSMLSTNQTRIQQYLPRIVKELEKLRGLENEIIANSMSSVIEERLYMSLQISELGIDALMNETSRVTTRSTDVHTAISLLISKLSIFTDLTSDLILTFSSMKISEYSVYERAFYFGITNCNGNIREAVEDTCTFLKNYCKDFFSDVQWSLEIMNWTLFCLGVISVAVVIPFIYRAQQNIVKIVLLFLNIPRKEIAEKIAGYEQMTRDIGAHFMQIKKIYSATNFCLEPSQAELRRAGNRASLAVENRGPSLEAGEGSDSALPLTEHGKTVEVGKEEESKVNAEKMGRESQINAIRSKSKTTFYQILLKTSLSALLFLGFALLQHYIRVDFFAKSQFSLDMLVVLLTREPYVTEGTNFLLEEIVQGKSILSKSGESLFFIYYNGTGENEASRYDKLSRFEGYYPSLFEDIARYDGREMCDTAKSNAEDDYDLEGCHNDANQLMLHGIKEVIGFLWAMSYNHHESIGMLSYVYRTMPAVIAKNLDGSGFSRLIDARFSYMSEVFSQINNKYQNAVMDYFADNITLQKILFVCYVIMVMLIFFLVIQLIIMELNTDIWKSKRLLALYPLQNISQNVEFFKKLISIFS